MLALLLALAVTSDKPTHDQEFELVAKVEFHQHTVWQADTHGPTANIKRWIVVKRRRAFVDCGYEIQTVVVTDFPEIPEPRRRNPP